MTTPAPAMDADPIHPYILDALRAARAGDLDALAWLEADCIAWQLLDTDEADLLRREIHRPARKRRTPAQATPGRTQRRRVGGNPMKAPILARAAPPV